MEQKAKIVCLCGSTRFHDAYVEANFQESMAGNIVLSCGVFGHTIHSDRPMTTHQKAQFDILHRRKILLADEILVINVDGYIGDSTRLEIEFAEAKGKFVRYWESFYPRTAMDDVNELRKERRDSEVDQ